MSSKVCSAFYRGIHLRYVWYWLSQLHSSITTFTKVGIIPETRKIYGPVIIAGFALVGFGQLVLRIPSHTITPDKTV
jgi:uncharacterized membrane protein